MAARRRLQPVEEPTRTLPDLRASVSAAVQAMAWLTPTDMALADVARAIADTIETAVGRAEEYEALQREAAGDIGLIKRIQKLEAQCDVAKTIGWQAPLLQSALRDLGGAPKARKEMQPDSPTGGRLAEMRKALTPPATDTPRG